MTFDGGLWGWVTSGLISSDEDPRVVFVLISLRCSGLSKPRWVILGRH